MSGRWPLGENGTWQVIRLAGMGVIYLYTMARRPSENATEVEAERRLFSRLECIGNKGATSSDWKTAFKHILNLFMIL